MVEAPTVRRLLETIELRLGRLQAIAGISLEEYQASPDVQDRAERNFEVCIQACIDLGSHILADDARSQPESYRDVFKSLAEKGLTDSVLSGRLEQMAGFRNILVHGYADIVAAKVHQNLKQLDDIREYVRQISGYLTDQGVL